MNTSTRLNDLLREVRYWFEDHGVAIAGCACILVFGALMSVSIHSSLQSEGYAATVTDLKSQEEKTSTDTFCNGDPVLLICGEEEVTEPAWYRVELTYSTPASDSHRNRGESCSIYVDQAQYQALKLGAAVEVQYRSWDGCSVEAWASHTV